MSECKKCPVCSIDNINGVFYWSHGPEKADSARVPASPDAVHTRVCRYAKKSGCINKIGTFNVDYSYSTELEKLGKKDKVDVVMEGLNWNGVRDYTALAEEILKEHQNKETLENSFNLKNSNDGEI